MAQENWICLVEDSTGVTLYENHQWETLTEFMDRISRQTDEQIVTQRTKITFQKVL